jgi:hypothetical protein
MLQSLTGKRVGHDVGGFVQMHSYTRRSECGSSDLYTIIRPLLWPIKILVRDRGEVELHYRRRQLEVQWNS